MTNFSKASGAALAITLSLFAGTALAASGIATGNVNVRTGPGTSFSKVDQLYDGEHVEIKECASGWCFVEHTGTDGWVSSNFLAVGGNNGPADDEEDAGGNGPGNPLDDCGIQIGPGGVQMGCGAGAPSNQPPPPQPQPPKPQPPKPPIPPKLPPKLTLSQVCFYSKVNYQGPHFCVAPGKANAKLQGFWNDRISSIKLIGSAKVMVCKDWYMSGTCTAITQNRPTLLLMNNKISSFKAF